MDWKKMESVLENAVKRAKEEENFQKQTTEKEQSSPMNNYIDYDGKKVKFIGEDEIPEEAWL